MNAKANLSRASIKKIISKLDLSPSEKKTLSVLDFDPYLTIDVDHKLAKPLLEDWTYFAVLSLADTADFKGRSEWVAQRLGISQARATKAMHDLQELGFLVPTRSGELKSTGVNLTLAGDIRGRKPPIKPVKSQLARLKLAQKSLQSLTIENFNESDFSSMTIAINVQKLAEAKKRITNFRRSLGKFLESSGTKQEVYILTMGLFPASIRSK